MTTEEEVKLTRQEVELAGRIAKIICEELPLVKVEREFGEPKMVAPVHRRRRVMTMVKKLTG